MAVSILRSIVVEFSPRATHNVGIVDTEPGLPHDPRSVARQRSGRVNCFALVRSTGTARLELCMTAKGGGVNDPVRMRGAGVSGERASATAGRSRLVRYRPPRSMRAGHRIRRACQRDGPRLPAVPRNSDRTPEVRQRDASDDSAARRTPGPAVQNRRAHWNEGAGNAPDTTTHTRAAVQARSRGPRRERR
jgi:hypothetical protein